MRLERRGSWAEAEAEEEDTGSGAETEETGSEAEAEDTGSKTGTEDTGSEAGGGGFRAGDEGLRPLGRLSTSGSIQKKRSKPLSSSSSTFSGLDSRSGNPGISRRVGRSSRLGGKGALLSGPLSGLIDIARGVAALTVIVVPP
jgi:hypothetical protein